MVWYEIAHLDSLKHFCSTHCEVGTVICVDSHHRDVKCSLISRYSADGRLKPLSVMRRVAERFVVVVDRFAEFAGVEYDPAICSRHNECTSFAGRTVGPDLYSARQTLKAVARADPTDGQSEIVVTVDYVVADDIDALMVLTEVEDFVIEMVVVVMRNKKHYGKLIIASQCFCHFVSRIAEIVEDQQHL